MHRHALSDNLSARFMALVHNPGTTEPLREDELDGLAGPQPIW